MTTLTPKGLLGGFDAAKLALDSLSGLIVLTSLLKGGGGRLPVGDLGEGNWLFEVVVNNGKKELLLAYVKVTITRE